MGGTSDLSGNKLCGLASDQRTLYDYHQHKGVHVTTNYEPDIDVLQRFKAAAEVVGGSSSDYPNLLRAYETTQDAVARARSHLASAGLEPCVDVLGLGSVGRFEMSQESDLDYLLVCHSDDDHDHTVALEAADGLRSVVIPGVELKEPGSTGLFGKWLRDEDLYEVIGLEEDKNSTHSRRALVWRSRSHSSPLSSTKNS